MKKKSVLPQLFFSTLYLSAFTFGGGYVIVSLMKKRFVDERHWISEDEILDLVAIAQSSPGPIAVNGAIVVGYKLAGLAGALTAAVATVIPPFVIIALVSYFYQLFRDNAVVSRVLAGMQAGVGAVIASVVGHGRGYRAAEKRLVDAHHGRRLCALVRVQGQCGLYRARLHRAGDGADAARKEEGRMILLQLFWSFLQIGLFSFGGGYAAMPLIQAQIVTQHGWLGMAEFTDLVTISQMTPGPIAINAATFVGLRVAGLSGALAATVGCMLPSCVLVTLLARLYLRYRKLSLLQGVLTSLRPAVVAMIASAGVSILVTAFWDEAVTFAGTNWRLVVIFASSLLLLRRTKLSPILVMLLAGAANLLLELLPLPF